MEGVEHFCNILFSLQTENDAKVFVTQISVSKLVST